MRSADAKSNYATSGRGKLASTRIAYMTSASTMNGCMTNASANNGCVMNVSANNGCMMNAPANGEGSCSIAEC